MTSIERTAYPRFQSPLTPAFLHEHFTPTPEEITFAEQQARGAGPLLTFLVLLKTFQCLWYFPQLSEIPAEVGAHLRWYLQVDETIPLVAPERTRLRYYQAIAQQLTVTLDSRAARQIATAAIERAAHTMDHPPDLINAAIETLLTKRCALPAFSTLDRLAGNIREQVNSHWWEQVLARIPAEALAPLDLLLMTDTTTGKSPFNQLKATPQSATLSHLEAWQDHLVWLRSLGDVATWLADVPATKIKHLADEARSLDVAEIRQHTRPKRYALLASLVSHAQMTTQDGLITMLLKRLAKMHDLAKADLEALLLRERATQEGWLEALADITRSAQEQADDALLGQQARQVVAQMGGAEHFLAAYEVLAKYHGNNYLPLMRRHFTAHRAALFRLIKALDIRSTSQDQSVVTAIQYLIANEQRKSRYVLPEFPLDFATDQWQRTVQVRRKKRLYYDRRRLEVCIFATIAAEFKSGDLAVPGSIAFADLREQLVPWEQCAPLVGEYCQQVGLPPDGPSLVQTLQEELTSLAAQVDARFLASGQGDIKNGIITLRHQRKPRPTREIQALDTAMQARMPPRTVLECLKNAYYYCNWPRHFGPLSGSESKLADQVTRYITMAFCYGCNVGPAQTAKHVRYQVTAHDLSYTNHRHVTSNLLDRANRDLINLYEQFTLPQLWGTGKTAAADGTQVEIVPDTLFAAPHIRYGGYGGIAYYLVSDKYVALFSHFITSGTWEGWYILDAMLKNTSDIQPETVHADTQGQTTTVFGLAYLLGIQLMPRIRNWKDLVFFRPDATTRYKHLDAVFTETIDWELLETHWADLMQVVLSIQAGKVLPSTLMRTLNNYSRKNRLYQVFRELGRVIRTLFLLRYISDRPLREGITATTNKVETYHAFAQWLSFGNNGKLTDSDPVEMEKLIKYNQLVANAVMIQNLVDMDTAIWQLQDEGYPVTATAVSGLSPYQHQHIRRYGEWDMSLADQPAPLTETILTRLVTRLAVT